MSDAVTRLNAALDGRYEIERELGEGGMATVYLAKDLKHNRNVALKVLKPELAAVVGAERFLAEIETTANLQHPHILPLFDSGEADSFLFYVMPYVEGETLRDKLDRDHQLPVDDAVQIAKNVAEALDYAHKRGVIHRDIKPANILLQAGKPVISDFGIALAVGAAGGGRLTETGLSLGTPHYMSPEQATGDSNVGPATDIYALGCVLYEMLVGDPPHVASTPQAILGKIITEPPAQVTKARKSVPTHVEAAIAKALEKVPADRFSDAAGFTAALADPAFRHGVLVGGVTPGGREGNRWRWVAAILAATTVGSLGVAAWAMTRAEPVPVAEFTLVSELDVEFASVRGVEVALSPDGSTAAFVGQDGNDEGIYLRALEGMEVTALPGAEGGRDPTFSPDGRSVLYTRRNRLIVQPLDGAPSYEVGDGGHGAWGEDGYIYHEDRGGDLIVRRPETGGAAEPFTSDAGGLQRYPHALPDGRGILVTLLGSDRSESRIAVAGPDGVPRELLIGTMAVYARTGHVVYATATGDIRAAPFDLARLELTGPSFGLLSGVQVKGGSASQFSVSRSGALLYKSGVPEYRHVLFRDRSGDRVPVDTSSTGIDGLRLSPDGSRVAMARFEDRGGGFLEVLDLETGRLNRLSGSESRLESPRWNAQGDSLIYVTDRGIFARRADGAGASRAMLMQESVGSVSLLPGRGEFVYERAGDLFRFRAGLDSVGTPLLTTPAGEGSPSVSPDERWLAFESDVSGAWEVYVVPYPDVERRQSIVSHAGGRYPEWSPSTRELLYYSEQVMAASAYEVAPDFEPGLEVRLFESPYSGAFDVDVSGGRILLAEYVTSGRFETSLVYVLNFAERLERMGRP